MKKYNYVEFYNLNLQDQIDYLFKNNLFHIKDDSSIDDLILKYSDIIDSDSRAINTIVNDYLVAPNKFYAKKVYNLGIEQLREYTKEGLNMNLTYNSTEYKFYVENLSGLDEKLIYTKKLRKKIIKIIHKKPLNFLKYTSFAIIHRDLLEEAFSDYWFGSFNTSPEDVTERKVNQDILYYLLTRQFLNRTPFNSGALYSFGDFTSIIYLYNHLDFLNSQILKLESSINELKKTNKTYGVSGSLLKKPPFFTDDKAFEIFKNCIKSESKKTKRMFGIYYSIFKEEGYIDAYRGSVQEFISFVKTEYNIEIQRLETSEPRDAKKELNILNSVLDSYTDS